MDNETKKKEYEFDYNGSEVEGLVLRAKEGEEDARAKLLYVYEPFIHSIAKDFPSYRDFEEDVVQAGQIGLLKALDKFDPSRGVKLHTFAQKEIRGEMLKMLGEARGGLTMSEEFRQFGIKVLKAANELEMLLEESPTNWEIYDHLRDCGIPCTIEKIDLARSTMGSFTSLDKPLGNEDNPLTMGDTVSYSQDDGPELLDIIQSTALTDNERKIFFAKTIDQIETKRLAEEMGVHESRINQIYRGAVVKIQKHLMRTDYLDRTAFFAKKKEKEDDILLEDDWDMD